MDAMVTARVPVEIKTQGNALLEKIGATQSDLINAAYNYVIKTGDLPTVADLKTSKKRNLNAADRKRLLESLDVIYIDFPDGDPWEGKSFKEIRDDMAEERYARFV